MDKIFKVDKKKSDFEHLAKLHKEGYKLVCAKCNSELKVALTLKEANEKGITTGIYCPKDGSHVYIHLYTREARDKMHQLFEKMKIDNREGKK